MADIRNINAYGESLNVKPGTHASSTDEYGLGNATEYGHVKITDTPVYTDDSNSGTAVTPKGIKQAFTDKGIGTVTNGSLLIGSTNNTIAYRGIRTGTLVANGTNIPTEGAVKSAISGVTKVSVQGTTLVFTAD